MNQKYFVHRNLTPLLFLLLTKKFLVFCLQWVTEVLIWNNIKGVVHRPLSRWFRRFTCRHVTRPTPFRLPTGAPGSRVLRARSPRTPTPNFCPVVEDRAGSATRSGRGFLRRERYERAQENSYAPKTGTVVQSRVSDPTVVRGPPDTPVVSTHHSDLTWMTQRLSDETNRLTNFVPSMSYLWKLPI